MGRSHGTGYPLHFKCTVAASIVWHDWAREKRERAEHKVSLTGRTRPTKHNGKGHPRKSWTTREWKCSCGATGWSSHTDLERMEGRAT
jgi:hypothetical protein